MKNNSFTIELTDVPDKDFLIAEVWFRESLLVEISQDGDSLQAEFFSHKNSLTFPLDDFLLAIQVAKTKLFGTKNSA